MMTIFVVIEEKGWGAERILSTLSEAGFNPLVVEIGTFKETLDCHTPALVIASLSGSLETGRNLCQELTGLTQAPIIAIGPSTDESYILGMFSAGVDNYLTQSIGKGELIARVRNMLRRALPSSRPLLLDTAPTSAEIVQASPQKNPVGKSTVGDIFYRLAHGVLGISRR